MNRQPVQSSNIRAYAYDAPTVNRLRARIAGDAAGLPPSPTRYWPPIAYSSPSSRAYAIVPRTLAPPPTRVKVAQSSP